MVGMFGETLLSLMQCYRSVELTEPLCRDQAELAKCVVCGPAAVTLPRTLTERQIPGHSLCLLSQNLHLYKMFMLLLCTLRSENHRLKTHQVQLLYFAGEEISGPDRLRD